MGVTKAVSSLFANLCFLPLSQIWSYEIFPVTGTRKGTNSLNAPPNLRKFHRRKHEKFRTEVLYFESQNITSWNRTSPRSLFEHA